MRFIGVSNGLKALAGVLLAFAIPLSSGADEPSVNVRPPELHSPRPLASQTAEAVVRDYLQSWQAMEAALQQNRGDLLAPDFIGTARDKLAAAVDGQVKANIHTQYEDRSHDIQIVFYSPEGLSVQLVDHVEYDQQVFHDGKLLASQPVRARYLVVLTPAEARWRVRIFQAQPE